MMQMVMDGASAGRSMSGHVPPPDAVQEALVLCSNACGKVCSNAVLPVFTMGFSAQKCPECLVYPFVQVPYVFELPMFVVIGVGMSLVLVHPRGGAS